MSTVMPRAPSVTRTLPCAINGASAWFRLTARLRICSFFTNCGAGLRRSEIAAGVDSGMLTGIRALAGAPEMLRNATTMESDMTRYFPSLTEEMPYMTTKKANSSVMKSAYDTSQRSWFSGSSVSRRRRRRLNWAIR